MRKDGDSGRGVRTARTTSSLRDVRGGPVGRREVKLATVRDGRGETAALVKTTGVLPLNAINEEYGTRWSTDLLALIESSRLREFRAWAAGLPRLDGGDTPRWGRVRSALPATAQDLGHRAELRRARG